MCMKQIFSAYEYQLILGIEDGRTIVMKVLETSLISVISVYSKILRRMLFSSVRHIETQLSMLTSKMGEFVLFSLSLFRPK